MVNFSKRGQSSFTKKKELRDHQIKALLAAEKYFKNNDRGKMIMACGTGKTFTSLRITEKIAGKGKFILYMVPSLALMSQTIREWKNDCNEDFEAFSACSDTKVGKKKTNDDEVIINLNELSFPATTDSNKLAEEIKKTDKSKMIVVFSTYQSIDVVSKAQNDHGLRNFDLILCDEAHRTTGATLSDEDESYFIKIHNNEHISGKKRLYMTATPRIYGEKAKQKADEGEAELSSMDDKKIFGITFFSYGFNEAVVNNLLTDYKVVILAIDEEKVSSTLQKTFEEGSELKLDDATKIIGCYKALAKVGIEKSLINKKASNPIKRALAFTQNISVSKIFQQEFKNVIDDFIQNEKIEEKIAVNLDVDVQHVDGTFATDKRNEKLNWLKEDTDKNHCRILTNVKCLSEGVDVPTLDAIMFLHPRKSQIDVVQSVGRVMRKADNKDMGYVIIPVTVAPGVAPERALNDSERYKVVWQILNALRSHDERMNNAINKISLGEDVSDKIQIMGIDHADADVTAVIDDIKPKSKTKKKDDEIINVSNENNDENKDQNDEWVFEIGDLSKAIKAKIVDKCGTRDYWENWAADIAKIAQIHITRLNSQLLKKNSKERKIFDQFLEEIRDDLNPEITENDAVEMLAQHIITKPVFDTLFQGNEFTKDNPVSKAIENVIIKIYDTNIDSETKTLEKFYSSVKKRSQDIVTSKGRSKLINELYERFFKNAFPRLTDKLGIVYTPIEVVDFMNSSINFILKEEFNKNLNSEKVHILDPFAGTGTFMVRLIESGLIDKKFLTKKYQNEIHSNEIVLLAYYIAGINIESAFHQVLKPNSYSEYKGMVLTDTFQLYEQDRDMIAQLLPDNSGKRDRQKKLDIRVIVGNPPYSAAQSSINDDSANVAYPNLDEKIRSTYASRSKSTNINKLYDSYIRAFRWSSDRLNKNGVIAFVTGSGWIDANAMSGMRNSFSKEFSKIYILNLRGNARTSTELRRKEGGNVFSQGSRSGIAITFLIKNDKNNKDNDSQIFYYDIGDYLSREQKLKKIQSINSIENIIEQNKFIEIKPNKFDDWINQVDEKYYDFISVKDKEKPIKDNLFLFTSNGMSSARDAWAINFSKKKLKDKIPNSIKIYNQQVKDHDDFNKVNKNKKDLSWSSSWKDNFRRKFIAKYNDQSFRLIHYRPFQKAWVYFDNFYIHRISRMPNLFPNDKFKNLAIVSQGIGTTKDYSCLMTNMIADYQLVQNDQVFPLKFVSKSIDTDQNKKKEIELFPEIENLEQSAISPQIKRLIINFYKKKNISDEDIFYYFYGVLNSTDFKKKFANNLSKDLPRMPLVKKLKDFEKFISLGRKLSDLHTNYEEVKINPILKVNFLKDKNTKDGLYSVKKMRFNKIGSKEDRSSIIYNNFITLENIPSEAYNFVVNGFSAIEWVMKSQMIKIDPDSGIVNDPNDFAIETMKDPKYPLLLLQKIISISIETDQIVKSLPKIEI